jgi:acetyl esterase/lipase
MSYPSLLSDLKLFNPSILLCLDDFLLSKDMLFFSLVSLHNERIGNPFINPLASPIQTQDHILKEFPKTRVFFCEIDPLRDACLQFIWRLKQLNVDLQAFRFKNWCHGVLNFDLKFSGIPESHKSNLLNVQWFREIFDYQGNNSRVSKYQIN